MITSGFAELLDTCIIGNPLNGTRRMNAPVTPPAVTPAPLADVSLEDKYALHEGVAFMSGMQALVRVAMHVRDRGERLGYRLGGYVSGYRGSPVGTLDMALWSAKPHLEPRDIRFQPGVNEDLAATAVWGSQQVHLLGGSDFDGVFGLWYGKSPGVDRTLDAFRHANCAGTAPLGGVLAIAGDDPNAVSSTVTGCSDYDFVSVGMPILYPASVQEMLDYGVMGIELSRYSGCWVGLKAVTDIAESSAIVDVAIDRVPLAWPALEADSERRRDSLGGGSGTANLNDVANDVHIRWPDNRVEQEKRLYTVKLPRAKAFARLTGLNQCVTEPSDARIGIVSAGKPWADLMQALADLGLGQEALASHGVRLFKLGMIYPLDEQQILGFAEGLGTVLVIEEKRGLIEDQIKSILYAQQGRPALLGKRGQDGTPLVPEHGETSPAMLAEVIARALPQLVAGPTAQARLSALGAKHDALVKLAAGAALPTRTPFFCSGCPHNSSTTVPDGSLALAGIGCHWLSLFMDRRNETFTQMGAEGATWLGAMGFSQRDHVFVNIGDGTYHHSGLLAIRAAIYAQANITYKLLFNDAVAMTGGQMVSDTFTPQQIVRQLLAEGVGKVVVVSDHPEKYREIGEPNGGFPAGVSLHGRDELDAIQRMLRDTSGVTALVYDQTCAAEKRRRRKRGTMVDPDVRAFINDAVCEGCGDCSVQSNCISVEPLETELGRKRQINQSACNKDLKCVDGFCPSFVTIEGARPRRATAAAQRDPETPLVPGDDPSLPRATPRLPDTPPALPRPATRRLDAVHETVITGIGGTGVITIGAILAMAARLEGRSATCLDQTGIAQKNGAVLSHVRIAPAADALHAPRISATNADLVLGCDMMVAASPAALATMAPGTSQVALNTHLAPHAAFVKDPVHTRLDADGLADTSAAAAGPAQVHALPATRIAEQVFGDAIATNMILLGYALQHGWLPVSLEAIQRAIELNGVAVKANLDALDCGRRAALDLSALLRSTAPVRPIALLRQGKRQPGATHDLTPGITIEAFIAARRTDLVRYQNEAYAARYQALLDKVRAAETRACPGEESLSRTVALQAFRVMAYKDEYEVARLYTDGRFADKIAAGFESSQADRPIRVNFHLAPPLLSKRDPHTGQLRKRRFGPHTISAMHLLARLKALRGTAFDPFGRSTERRLERALADTYLETIDALLPWLNPDNHAKAVEIATIPEAIRGFGHVKHRNLQATLPRWQAAATETPAEQVIARYAASAAR